MVIVIVLLVGFLAADLSIARARQDEDDSNTRYMTVTTTYTQYSWQLVSKSSGRILCLININHSGMPTVQETMAVCQYALFPLATIWPTETAPAVGTPVPTPTDSPPTSTPVTALEALDQTNYVFAGSREVTQTQKTPIPSIVINISGNQTPSLKPYATITAYEPLSEYQITSIQGVVGGNTFTCYSSSCDVIIASDTTITYWANSSFGDQSPNYTATIRVSKKPEGYQVYVEANENFSLYTDACGPIWGTGPTANDSNWADFPQNPQSLATTHKLYYLAGELIKNRVVNTENCPGNGLFSDGSPNACGMDTAMPAVIEWQNHYDPAIWSAGREIGIPPVLIKSVIEQETQFWPASTHFALYEYGLAQINEQGADVALRWDNSLFKLVCNNMLMECKSNYAQMTEAAQALLRNGLLTMLNADCPSCKYGVDTTVADESMRIIAQIMQANCYQTGYLYQTYSTKANYADSWRFTLVSFHGGYQCLSDGIATTLSNGEAMTWENLSTHLSECYDTVDYVNNVWALTTGFQPNPALSVESRPAIEVITAVPPPTATPPPDPMSRDGDVQVIVFIDNNNDYVLDTGELVNGVDVTVQYEDGTKETKKSVNGEASFIFKNKLKGSKVTIMVPQVYRTMNVSVPDDGKIFALIRLSPPVLPTKLP